MVLLSDGESNTGIIRPEQAVEAAKKLGIKVYTIGVGTSGEAPVLQYGPNGKQVVQFTRVRLDEAFLRKAAADTGGRYFHVRDASGLEEAMTDIDRLERTRIDREVFEQYKELYGRLLVPALALLLIASWASARLAGAVV